MQKRNYYIELLRFIFCILILLHHSGLVSPDGSGLVPSAGVIADAFFIITGYFACRHIAHMTEKPVGVIKYSIVYTFNKLKRVLPYSTFGVVIIYLLELLHLDRTTSVREHLGRLYTMTVEILLLPMTGIMEVNLITLRNAPLWYLSATLIALPLVVFMAIKCGKVFRYCLVWIIPILLEIWMVTTYGGALPWITRSKVFIYSGAIRGFSDIVLGFSVYYAAEWFTSREKAETTWKRALFSMIESLLLIYILRNICYGIGGYMETLTIYLIAVMFVLVFSGKTITASINYRWLELLGSLSLPVYCIHWGIYRWVGAYLGMLPYYAKVIITIVICLVAAFVLNTLVELVRKKQAEKKVG